MLTDEQLSTFGRHGYLVVPEVVAEPVLAELAAEADALIASQPAPEGKVGFHHYFEHPSTLPVADRVLRESGVLALAGELVAPLAIDLAFAKPSPTPSRCWPASIWATSPRPVGATSGCGPDRTSDTNASSGNGGSTC